MAAERVAKTAGFEWSALRSLAPHLWPAANLSIGCASSSRSRLLAAAKLATVYVPMLFKRMVDLFSDPQNLPVVLPLEPGRRLRPAARRHDRVRRAARRGVRQGRAARDPHAWRCETFRHLHALSLRFHLERQTGGLSRAIERGTTRHRHAAARSCCSTSCPTLLEIVLVCGILWGLFDVALRRGHVRQRRRLHRLHPGRHRVAHSSSAAQMNETDQEANTKAIDSLLNYETVKYFGNEQHEARRFDQALARYERASVASKSTLSLLNIGQAAIIARRADRGDADGGARRDRAAR